MFRFDANYGILTMRYSQRIHLSDTYFDLNDTYLFLDFNIKIMNCTADLICTHLQEALLYSQIELCKVPVENSTGAYALSPVCPCFKYDSWFSIFHILALGMCQLALNNG